MQKLREIICPNATYIFKESTVAKHLYNTCNADKRGNPSY